MVAQGVAPSDREKIEDLLAKINSVLMVMDLSETESNQEIEELLRERNSARETKDWARADVIREKLKELGIAVIDTPDGTTWRKIR